MKIRGIVLFIGCSNLLLYGQDPGFSQYEVVKPYYNPAFTGDANNIRAGIAYRNLWPNVPGRTFPGPMSTYMAHVDFQMRNQLVGGLGAFVVQDFEGEGHLRYTSGGVMYSYHVSTKGAHKPVFQFYSGFKLSINQLRIDWSRLEFSDQFDATTQGVVRPSAFTPGTDGRDGRKSFFDVDFGIAGRFLLSDKWSNEVSFSVAHIVRPDISLTGTETILPIKYSGHFITSFPIKKLFLSPKVLAESQGKFLVITPGITLFYGKRISQKIYTNPFYIGFYYRNGFSDFGNTRSLIFNVGHNGFWQDKQMKYQVGFSYDATMIGLPVGKTFGAIELTATIILNTRKLDRMSKRCPEFEGSPLGPIQ